MYAYNFQVSNLNTLKVICNQILKKLKPCPKRQSICKQEGI